MGDVTSQLPLRVQVMYMRIALEHVLEDTEGLSERSFQKEDTVGRRHRDLVVYGIGVAGEVAKDIIRSNPFFTTMNEELQLKVLRTMRDRLFHDYHQIDYTTLWDFVERRVPKLLMTLRQVRV